MTIQLLSLVAHPTVIGSVGAGGPFQGWGVRIGC